MNSIEGMKFTRLTALRIVGKTKDNRPAWLCRCDCGNEVIVSEHNLKRNNTKSCGCYKRDAHFKSHYKHGNCKTRLYRIWSNMKSRCDRESNDNYQWYGGRGISYAKEWSDYSTFEKWAIANGYDDSLELDRINTNGDYSPDNCRFITHQANCQNRRKKIQNENSLEKINIA